MNQQSRKRVHVPPNFGFGLAFSPWMPTAGNPISPGRPGAPVFPCRSERWLVRQRDNGQNRKLLSRPFLLSGPLLEARGCPWAPRSLWPPERDTISVKTVLEILFESLTTDEWRHLELTLDPRRPSPGSPGGPCIPGGPAGP